MNQHLSSRSMLAYQTVAGLVRNLFELAHTSRSVRDNRRLAEAMNLVAPRFFGAVQQTMLHSAVMILRHLNDRERTTVKRINRDNASLAGLLAVAFGNNETAIPSELSELLKRIKEESGPVIQKANKLIAHSDMAVSIGEETIAPVELPRIIRISALCRKFMRTFETHWSIPRNSGGASELLTELLSLECALRLGQLARAGASAQEQ